MKYTFVHKLNNVWSGEEQLLLDRALELTAASDSGFLKDCCRFLAEEFRVPHVLIGKIMEKQQRVRTLAFIMNGEFIENLEYELNGTPCEKVVDFGVCYYPFGVQGLFPKDKELEELGVESYIGTPINDCQLNRIGLVALLHSKTIEQAGLIDACITILAPRLEEEILKAP